MNANRPLSPHLQVYRLPLTGLISISHRITGVLLSLGLLLFAYMLSMAATGEPSYLALQAALDLAAVRFIFWGFIYSLFFHLCHGVRHLVWDAGYGFRRETSNRYAILELLASVALTGGVYFVF